VTPPVHERKDLSVHSGLATGDIRGVRASGLAAVARDLLTSIGYAVGVLRSLFTHHKRILLACENLLEADYLKTVWNVLARDTRLRGCVMPGRREEHPGERDQILSRLQLPGISLFASLFVRWDMVLVAAHGLRILTRPDRWPVVHVPHGPGDKTWGDPQLMHTYGRLCFDEKDRLRYTVMLEGSEQRRRLVEARDRRFAGKIAVVGNPLYDELLEKSGERERIRKELGIQPSQTLVFVMGTFREDSLFEAHGDVLLEAARPLIGEYQFVLSAHPQLYRRVPGKRDWKAFLHEQKNYGFFVRDPEQDFIPWMIASDILLTDHTGLCIYGALLGKPAVFVTVPDSAILRDSPTWRYREISLELDDPSRLESVLSSALKHYPHGQLRSLADEIHPYRGESARRVRDVLYPLLHVDLPRAVEEHQP